MPKRQRLRPSVYRDVSRAVARGVQADHDRLPWRDIHSPIRLPRTVSGRPFSGINAVLLWSAMAVHRYRSCYWATEDEWSKLGLRALPFAPAKAIVQYRVAHPRRSREVVGAARPMFVRIRHVINADEVSRHPAAQQVRVTTARPPTLRVVAAVVRAYVASTCEEDSIPLLRAVTGEIESWDTHTPPAQLLFRMAAVCATVVSRRPPIPEVPSHLRRLFFSQVSELSGSILCARFGSATPPRGEADISREEWLSMLEQHPRSIFSAAARAQKLASSLTTLTRKLVQIRNW